jgi:hypothetical protein
MIQSCSYITPELECHEILIHVLQVHPFNDLLIERRHLMHLFAGVGLHKLLGVPSRSVRKRHQESQGASSARIRIVLVASFGCRLGAISQWASPAQIRSYLNRVSLPVTVDQEEHGTIIATTQRYQEDIFPLPGYTQAVRVEGLLYGLQRLKLAFECPVFAGIPVSRDQCAALAH